MRALMIDGPRSARWPRLRPPSRRGPGRGGRSPGRDLRYRRRAVHRGAGLLRAGKVPFPAASRPRVVRVVSAVGAGVDEPWLGARVTGDTMLGCGHCRAAAAGKRARLRGSPRDRDHGLAGCAGRQGAGARDQPAPAAGGGLTTGRARWSTPAATPSARRRPLRPDLAGGSSSADRARSGCSRSPSPAPRARTSTSWRWTRAAANSRRGSAPPVLDGRRSAERYLRRGHRLHRRSPGSRRRPGAGRAGRAGGLHRRCPSAEPDRQPRPGAQRPHGGGHPRRVGGPGDRHRALRRRPGGPGRPGGSSLSASTALRRRSPGRSIRTGAEDSRRSGA